jgi:hypothetical protein
MSFFNKAMLSQMNLVFTLRARYVTHEPGLKKGAQPLHRLAYVSKTACTLGNGDCLYT